MLKVRVNVFAFLFLGHERATAVPAVDQTRKRKLVFCHLLLACVPPIEDFLHAVENLG